jgi:hypothetical protein
MEKLQLKPYLPIYQAGNTLCIGIVGTNYFIEYESPDSEILSIIHNLLEYKYHIDDAQNIPLLMNLLQKGMVSTEVKTNFTRNELFFQYLDIPFLPKVTLESRILIFGVGAAGATLAFLLAQFGFSNLIVVTIGASKKNGHRPS